MNENNKKPLDKKLWLSSPTMHGDELEYINDAYNKNWMSTVGENIDAIEKYSCELIGTDYAVALSSGTAALHLAIKLSNVKQGEKVFCSDLTFAATVNPIVYEGAEPIFIDSEKDTWNMDPYALENAFIHYPKVRVVVLVHLYGTPAKVDQIYEICKKYGAILIEDAAESLGSLYKCKQTASYGRYNIISFNGNKIITGSSGGMLLTNDKDSADKARKWSTQSREDAIWYQHKEIGYNYRMSNVIAGVVRGQYKFLDEHIKRKTEIYLRYMEGLKNLPITMNPYLEDISKPNFWLSCLLIDEKYMCKQIRDDNKSKYFSEIGKSCPTEILENLLKFNIEARPIWKPMHMQPLYSKNVLITRDEIYSSSEKDNVGILSSDIFDRGLCLPSDIKMTEEQQDLVINIIIDCFK